MKQKYSINYSLIIIFFINIWGSFYANTTKNNTEKNQWHTNWGINLNLLYSYTGYFANNFYYDTKGKLKSNDNIYILNDGNLNQNTQEINLNGNNQYYTSVNHWFLGIGFNYRRQIFKKLFKCFLWENILEYNKGLLLKSGFSYLFFIKKNITEVNFGFIIITPFYFNKNKFNNFYNNNTNSVFYSIDENSMKIHHYIGFYLGFALILNDIFPPMYLIVDKSIKINISVNWDYKNWFLFSLSPSAIEKPTLKYNIVNNYKKKRPKAIVSTSKEKNLENKEIISEI